MKLATIEGIYADGVTLRFDDGTTSQKHYKTNANAKFAVGDRVKCDEANGNMLVDYPIGVPAAPEENVIAGGAQNTGGIGVISFRIYSNVLQYRLDSETWKNV